MSASLTTWRVSGMHCPACKATIERALRGVAATSLTIEIITEINGLHR